MMDEQRLKAMEAWVAQELEYFAIRGDPDAIASFQSVAALIAEVRRLRIDLAYWKTCSGCGEQMDAPGHCTNAETEWIKGQLANLEQAHDERDDARQHVEMLEKSLASLSQAVEALHDYETTGAPDYHEWDRYFDAVYAAAREGQ